MSDDRSKKYVSWSTLQAYYGAAIDNILTFASGALANIIPEALHA